jgi:hypothetical protein
MYEFHRNQFNFIGKTQKTGNNSTFKNPKTNSNDGRQFSTGKTELCLTEGKCLHFFVSSTENRYLWWVHRSSIDDLRKEMAGG